jgi:uncharacterized protein YjiK
VNADARLRALPESEIEPRHVLELADLGANTLEGLLKHWKRFTPAGLDTLEALTGTAAPNRTAMRFTQREHYVTGVEQQSALTFISEAVGFMVAGDDSSALFAVKPQGGRAIVTQVREDDGELAGIEGMRFNRKNGKLRVVSEDSRRVWEMRFDLRKLELSAPDEIGKIERLGKKNKKVSKGYEGLDILHAEQSPDRTEYQLAIHEGKPRRVAFLDPKTLEVQGLADVPESLRSVLPDLSDSAVSPRGTLFLLSDEGNAFVEFAVRKIDRGAGPGRSLPQWTLVPLATTEIDPKGLPLAGADRLQPEGLSFDDKGDLWVACEANSLLLRFEQQRG